ncbi:uncharacterized protein LOC110312861 [Mus pahari]|uniref:uncharacterized protein LOC110312861 n=1 Tax=Mus pahari TaxID=10093 RepID=UPI000A313775|nr:uncharacterized protein LOC110312861 [Mus pahari]
MCQPSVRKHHRDEEMRNPETQDLVLLSNRLALEQSCKIRPLGLVSFSSNSLVSPALNLKLPGLDPDVALLTQSIVPGYTQSSTPVLATLQQRPTVREVYIGSEQLRLGEAGDFLLGHLLKPSHQNLRVASSARPPLTPSDV